MGALEVQERDGQMAVELALLIPAVVVLALVVVNLMQFTELCARFDRVSLDAVLTHGVSPTGSPEGLGGVEEVRVAIETAMDDASCEVEVSVQDASEEGSAALIDFSAGTVRFVCALRYRPWPSSVSVAGVGYQVPALLGHEREIVVDRYRAGVVT